MRVKILKVGKYKEFTQSGGLRAQRIEAGAEFDFPDAYAEYLITVGLAAPAAGQPVAIPAPEPEPAPVENTWGDVDIEAMPLGKIRQLDLPLAGWRAMLAVEEHGKSRKSVVEFIQSKIAELAA